MRAYPLERSHPCDGCGVAIQTCAVMHDSNYSCCNDCDHTEEDE